jgi:hypothetical protein
MDWLLSRATARRLGSGIVVAALAMGAGISPVAASSVTSPSSGRAVRHLARSQPTTAQLPATVNVKATQLSDGSVRVAWGGAGGVTYDVYRSTVAGAQGSKINARPVHGSQYSDDTAQAGTQYFYTVVAHVTAGRGEVQSRASAQVKANVVSAQPVVKVNRTSVKRTAKSAKHGSQAPAKTVAKRALTAKPQLIAGACDVQLPDYVTASQHNFGCPAGSQVELLRQVGTGADCTTLTTPNCDVYIGDSTHNVTETIDPGTIVYVDNAVDNESVAGDPSNGVDFLVNQGSTFLLNGSTVYPAAIKSINEEPGSTTAAAPGDWGVIEYGYNGSTTGTSTGSGGYVVDTNVDYGSGFWFRNSTVNFTGDVLRDMAGSASTLAPGNSIVYWDFTQDPAANGSGTHAIVVNGVDLIGDSASTGEEGFYFNEASSTDGNAPDITFSNSTVSNVSYPFDAELVNDNSGGSVGGNLTLHMFGDSTPNVYDSSYGYVADSTDANGGNDTLTLDVHDNHAPNNLSAGGLQGTGSDYVLDAEAYAGTGNASVTGTVANSHIAGQTYGVFTEAASDESGTGNTGNASVSGLTFANDNIHSNGSGDGAFDGEAYAYGAGNSSASPTFTNDTIVSTGGDAVDLYAETYYGAGNATVSPAVTGGLFQGYDDALYQDSEIDTTNTGEGAPTGSATADGTFTNAHLLAEETYARDTYVKSNLGAATDTPTFSSSLIESPDNSSGRGLNFVDEIANSASTAALTVTPSFTGSTVSSQGYGLYTDEINNYGAGNTIFSPVFSNSAVNVDSYDAVHASVYDNGGTSSTGVVQMDPVFTNSTVKSLRGFGVHLFNEVHGKSTDQSPQVTNSTFNTYDAAIHAHNYATYGGDGGDATTSPVVSGSNLASTNDDVVDLEAYSYTNAVVDPSFTGDSLTTPKYDAPYLYAFGSDYDSTNAGNAEALPTFSSDTISGEGPDVQAVAWQSNSNGVSGSADAGGSTTNSTILSNYDEAYFSLAEQTNGLGAQSDPTFSSSNISSASSEGVDSYAYGWTKAPVVTTHSGIASVPSGTAANISYTGGSIGGYNDGAYAWAQDVNWDAYYDYGFLPDPNSTGPVSSDVQLSGTPVYSSDGKGVFSGAETDFVAGTVSATGSYHNGHIDSYSQDENVSAYSSWGDCFDYCGTEGQINSSATGAASSTGSLTSDTANMPVSNRTYGDSDLWQTTTADDAAASSTATVNNVAATTGSAPAVDTEADYNNQAGGDKASTAAAITNYTNDGSQSGQYGVYVTNYADGTGGASNSGTLDYLTLKQFNGSPGVGWYTGSGGGDTGTVSVTHSNLNGGTSSDGLDVESINPAANGNAPIAYLQGNFIDNITDADGIYDFGFVPEVIGNDIYGATGTGALDVEESSVSNSATLTLQRAQHPQRPAIPELSNGTISGNFLHDSNGGIQLDADVTLMPNVNNNDFAGNTQSGPPDGYAPGPFLSVLATDSNLVVDATNNWWGTTDATQIAGLYYTAGATVDVSPYLMSPGMTSGYVLDGWGGVHPYGGAATPSIGAYWPGWNIARGITTSPDGLGGYVLDGWGGVHAFGNLSNPAITAYWKGWDIARGIAQVPGSPTEGYVLDGWGGVHPFGGAPDVTISAYWPGWDIAKGIVVNPPSHLNPCVSGYVLDGWGGIHPFADTSAGDGCSAANMPATPTDNAYWHGWNIARGIALDAYGEGYTLDGWGGVHPFGGAASFDSTAYWPGWDIARSIVINPMGSGYVLDGWGGIHPYGFAPPVPSNAYWPGWDIAKGIS